MDGHRSDPIMVTFYFELRNTTSKDGVKYFILNKRLKVFVNEALKFNSLSSFNQAKEIRESVKRCLQN